MSLIVDDDVKEMILSEDLDYRLSTSCSGPALLSVIIKPPKPTDLVIPVGDHNFLYVSKVQLDYVDRITMDMVYDPEKLFNSCSALRTVRDRY